MRRPRFPVAAAARRSLPLGVVAALGLAARASAHGPVPADPPTAVNLLFGWTIEPDVALVLALIAFVWIRFVRQVNRAHPANPVPRRRSICFLAGLAVIAFSLMSGIDTYDTTLFSVHMVQHLLLTLVAAPLIVLGAPITLLLRVSTPNVRHRVILPILHSRVMKVLSFPVVAWVLFAATMWWTHFSPIFDLALENPAVHDFEHLLYLTVGLLFWWPAVGLDPSPWRMSHPVRAMYVFLQMPQNTFLAVTIMNSPIVLYAHGTGGSFHSYINDGTATRLAAQGLAVISIDQVLHGPRNPNGNPELDFFNFLNPKWDKPLQLQFNPDVSIREVGVMEKCTFCVQRIKAAEINADAEKRELKDGELQPACAQTCRARSVNLP